MASVPVVAAAAAVVLPVWVCSGADVADAWTYCVWVLAASAAPASVSMALITGMADWASWSAAVPLPSHVLYECVLLREWSKEREMSTRRLAGAYKNVSHFYRILKDKPPTTKHGLQHPAPNERLTPQCPSPQTKTTYRGTHQSK